MAILVVTLHTACVYFFFFFVCCSKEIRIISIRLWSQTVCCWSFSFICLRWRKFLKEKANQNGLWKSKLFERMIDSNLERIWLLIIWWIQMNKEFIFVVAVVEMIKILLTNAHTCACLLFMLIADDMRSTNIKKLFNKFQRFFFRFRQKHNNNA